MTSSDTAPVAPPATLGMIGGGQLGKYALIAANQMGFRTLVVDPDADAPAGTVAHDHLVAAYDAPDALDVVADRCDVVTTEFENAPADALERLERSIRVAPRPEAVAIAQDRIVEKTTLDRLGIDVGPFAPLRAPFSAEAMDEAHRLAAGGAIVKTARFGYDGKGQVHVDDADALPSALRELGEVDCIVEKRLRLDVELSVLVARAAAGTVSTWAVTENVHVDGILDLSVAPARVEASLAERATAMAIDVATRLDYVGVLGVEMFVAGDELLVNEIAPRPHNSGHWTLDASRTSQFEQQIRAVCGLELGDPAMTSPAVAMVNLLGDLWSRPDRVHTLSEPAWSDALHDPAASLHLYGKRSPRPGRKMGHLTVTSHDADDAVGRACAARTRANAS